MKNTPLLRYFTLLSLFFLLLLTGQPPLACTPGGSFLLE